MNIIIKILFISISLFIFSCTNKNSSNIVVTYDGGVISLEDFEDAFITDYLLGDVRLAKKSKLETREGFAQRLALHAIKAKIAKERGLDTTKEFLNFHKKTSLQIAKKIANIKFIDDKYITDIDKKEAYNRYQKKLKGKHLFFPINASIDSMEVVRNAEKVLGKLQKGEGFTSQMSSSCQYSDNWITSFTMPYEFEKEIWKLKINEISPLIHSFWGIHIFQLDSVLSIRKYIGTYKESKEDIEYGLRKQFANVLVKQKLQKKIYFELYKKCQGRFNDNALNEIFEQINKNDLSNAIKLYNDSPILFIGTTEIPCSVFFNKIKLMSYKFRKNNLKTIDDYKYIILKEAREDLIAKIVEITEFYKNPLVGKELNQNEDLFLSGELNKIEIVNKSKISDEDIQYEYEHSKKESNMYLSARDSITEIYVEFNNRNKTKKKKQIEKIYQSIKRDKDSFDKFLANDKNSRFRYKKGNLFWVTDIQYQPIGKLSKNMKEGDISNIIEGYNFFSIIRIEKKTGMRLKPFDMIKNIIEPKLKNERIKARVEAYKNELIKKYKVQVSREMLLKAFL